MEFIRFHLYRKKWTDSTLYAALVVLPGDSTPHFIPLFEEKQLQRLLNSFLAAKTKWDQLAAIDKLYGKGTKAASAASPSSLYQLLWKPLEKYLRGIHTIYYAPAGLLHRIAFGALRTDATHLLIDKYQLKEVLSTRSVALSTEVAQKPRSVALWGNINYNTPLSTPLQLSSDTTASWFNVDTADTSDIFTLPQNPMFRSGLILAGGNHAWRGEPTAADVEDGIVMAYEIAQMDLSSTDIVVLSACETALGDVQGNEGVIGLQRAFKLAGVKQLIMSLWRVLDKETVELVTLFYRNWIGGQSTREALRNAQLKMKEKYPPYYWAAFVVVE